MSINMYCDRQTCLTSSQAVKITSNSEKAFDYR